MGSTRSGYSQAEAFARLAADNGWKLDINLSRSGLIGATVVPQNMSVAAVVISLQV